MPQHDPVVNPSLHYLGVEGATTRQNHEDCVAQNARIKAERSDEYGPDGAYNHQMCNSHGVRFDGRGWDRDGAANGGENGIWYNAGSRSLCVLVGTDDVITDVCKAGIRAWANEAISRGMQWPLRGHSEFVATSCPGDHLRVVVQEVNANPAQGDDDVTDEQMGTLGQWMKDGEARIEKAVLDTVGQWLKDVESRLGKKIDAK